MTTPQSQWQKLLSADRLSPKPAQTTEQAQTNATQKELGRTDFHTDYDRVVFCNAFRRLGRKTQVHAFAKSDHTHNRLTHSVEVASVGRSLGNQVGQALQVHHLLPHGVHFSDIGTIVQVACLAHDLGNPRLGIQARTLCVNGLWHTHSFCKACRLPSKATLALMKAMPKACVSPLVLKCTPTKAECD